MSHTKTTAISYGAILKKAKSGDYKLPAFQRKWRWTTRQVMALYESLRLNYPIGALLFLTSPEGEKLAPRAFHGAGKIAAGSQGQESLVLDGQQRITAGISIYYGLSDVDGSEYYIDSKKVDELLADEKVNLDDEDQVARFISRIDLESGYLTAKPHRADRSHHLSKSGLIWTAYLTPEKSAHFDDLIDGLEKRQKDIIRKVIRPHLAPNVNIQVPVIELGSEFDLAAISKVFSTINSSGKLLTPFELVVAILYPHGVTLEDDVDGFKERYRYYANMDKNGEVLLQVIALLSGKSPKKADLPKNIEAANYNRHSDTAAKLLNETGEFLTRNLGLGLDVTSKLAPYDALFAPFAVVLSRAKDLKLNNAERGEAHHKLRRWFVASTISQRYQEGVHSKQERDVVDMEEWIKGGAEPRWITNTVVTPSLKSASPSGALGKLLLCLMNASRPHDPVLGGHIGFSDGATTAQVHHIFPTRWAPKGIADYKKDAMDTNVALNTMLISAATNADWLNFDPKNQVELTSGSLQNSWVNQLVPQDAIDVLKKDSKTVADFNDFIDCRYRAVVQRMVDFGIIESSQTSELVELDEPSIIED